MDYIGEQLLPGKIGHLLLIISFVASLIATFAYFKSTRAEAIIDQRQWKKLGRIAFCIDAIAVIAVFAILYYLISNHRYEYYYVYKNSGNDLEPKYILSSLWSASEGSFLLWALWHGVLGIILIFTSRKWEGPVMTVLSFAQVCLATMLIGLYIFDVKIGASPFALFREQMSELPVFTQANYLSLPSFQDGRGLNQLLQNYWMVIHPPVLFLGFASIIVPFAFAIGGLWTKNHKDWGKPALPWALFSAAILGVGIMMGAAWAYESLSFGGYWAWDPVENASLVPWLVLIAAIHTLLIYKHTGRSLRTTYLFFILAFVLIIYSTFLTRSGILGDTSVHSFADLGMNFQLFLFIMVFLVPALVLFFTRYKEIPFIPKEEEMSSREFWMFIGSLVFFFASLVIISKTSVPVVNKLFGTKIAPPENVEYSYNSIMVWVAVIIAALTAIGQYFKYKQTTRSFFWKKIIIPTLISVAVAALVLSFSSINYYKFGPGFHIALWLALIASIYSVIANLSYIWLGIKGSLKLSGGSIAHAGFGMVLIGILISSSNKEVLSHNINGIPVPLAEDENPMENLTLVKGVPTTLGKFTVTYTRDSVHPQKPKYYYHLNFLEKEGKEKFILTPNAFVNYQGQEGLMANPDARHYWDHDVFTYITSLPNPDRKKDTASFKTYTLKPGDSLFYSSGFVLLQEVREKDSLPKDIFGEDGSLHEAPLKIYAKTGSIYSVTPKLAIAKGNNIAIPDTITAESLVLRLQKVNPDNSIELGLRESDDVLQFLTIKAYKFPMINLLWLGIIITAIGILISMVRRIQLTRKAADPDRDADTAKQPL